MGVLFDECPHGLIVTKVPKISSGKHENLMKRLMKGCIITECQGKSVLTAESFIQAYSKAPQNLKLTILRPSIIDYLEVPIEW